MTSNEGQIVKNQDEDIIEGKQRKKKERENTKSCRYLEKLDKVMNPAIMY